MSFIETGSRLPPGMTPSIIRGARAGPSGPSFFTLPVRIIDQVYLGVGGPAFDIDFRFHTTGSVPANKCSRKDVDNSIALVPDQPQWKDDALGAPAYSIRHVSFEGTGTPVFDFPVIDVWLPMANPEVFGMNRPPFGTTEFITFRVEIAETADVSDVKASALYTLSYHRTI